MNARTWRRACSPPHRRRPSGPTGFRRRTLRLSTAGRRKVSRRGDAPGSSPGADGIEPGIARDRTRRIRETSCRALLGHQENRLARMRGACSQANLPESPVFAGGLPSGLARMREARLRADASGKRPAFGPILVCPSPAFRQMPPRPNAGGPGRYSSARASGQTMIKFFFSTKIHFFSTSI